MPSLVLLDSSALFRIAFESSRLPLSVAALIDDPGVRFLYSPFTVVEFATKVETGKLVFRTPVYEWVTNTAAALSA